MKTKLLREIRRLAKIKYDPNDKQWRAIMYKNKKPYSVLQHESLMILILDIYGNSPVVDNSLWPRRCKQVFQRSKRKELQKELQKELKKTIWQ